MKNLNKTLKLIREHLGYSINEMAEKLNVRHAYIWALENDKCGIGIKSLERYANLLKIPVSWVLFLSDNLKSKKILSQKEISFPDKFVKLLSFVNENNSK